MKAIKKSGQQYLAARLGPGAESRAIKAAGIYWQLQIFGFNLRLELGGFPGREEEREVGKRGWSSKGERPDGLERNRIPNPLFSREEETWGLRSLHSSLLEIEGRGKGEFGSPTFPPVFSLRLIFG